MRRAQLTERDEEILEALTRRVRVLTLNQIARTWWDTSKHAAGNARDRLGIIEAAGLVQLERMPAHPELPLSAPEATWAPGDDAPDFGALSYRLQSRWKEHPVLTLCVSATRLAVNRLGGHGGRFPRQVERTHDIHLAHVYLVYRERHPHLLPGWIFEEALREERGRRSKERLPDVILEYAGRRKVVEFGGAYPKTKLAAFHRYCEDQNLPYEVW